MKYVFNLSNTHRQSASNTHAGRFGGLCEGTRSPSDSRTDQTGVFTLRSVRGVGMQMLRDHFTGKRRIPFYRCKHYLW